MEDQPKDPRLRCPVNGERCENAKPCCWSSCETIPNAGAQMVNMHEGEFRDWFTKTKRSGHPNSVWSEEKQSLYVQWLADRMHEEERMIRMADHQKRMNDLKLARLAEKVVSATMTGKRRRHHPKKKGSKEKVTA